MSHTAAIKMQKPASTARAYDNFEKSLFARKRELEARIATLLGDVSAQTEPEDEGGIAIDNYSKDWAAANLERSRRTLREVDTALARIKQGNYGVCDVCNISIPKARLEALPWARVCVSCAERTAQTHR
ncbi:MAG: TraR/DksA C4-type zinc finger protein [Candidatus Acidiferrales bacterium]